MTPDQQTTLTAVANVMKKRLAGLQDASRHLSIMAPVQNMEIPAPNIINENAPVNNIEVNTSELADVVANMETSMGGVLNAVLTNQQQMVDAISAFGTTVNHLAVIMLRLIEAIEQRKPEIHQHSLEVPELKAVVEPTFLQEKRKRSFRIKHGEDESFVEEVS